MMDKNIIILEEGMEAEKYQILKEYYQTLQLLLEEPIPEENKEKIKVNYY